jgi:hypothetical protein
MRASKCNYSCILIQCFEPQGFKPKWSSVFISKLCHKLSGDIKNRWLLYLRSQVSRPLSYHWTMVSYVLVICGPVWGLGTSFVQFKCASDSIHALREPVFHVDFRTPFENQLWITISAHSVTLKVSVLSLKIFRSTSSNSQL